MHNEANQKISMFIDNELDYDESLDLLKKIRTDDVLKARMMRYQAISHTLKTEEFQQLRSDFSDKISQQIKQEPVYFLPKTSVKPQRKKMFAIAASTIAAVVLVGEAIKNHQDEAYPTIAATNVTALQQLAGTSIATLKPEEKDQNSRRQPMNAQFNDYLRAHNASTYTSGEVNIQPYARVAAFGKD